MTPDPRAARERKQKIFVLVGGLVPRAMLAFQLPKLLRWVVLVRGDDDCADTTSTRPRSRQRPRPRTGVGGRGPTTVVSVSASGIASTPKLTSFSIFQRKDPFVQQVVTADGLEPPAAGVAKDGKAGAKGDTPTGTFATGAKGTAAATIVTVNGARQVLEPGMKFPAGDPLFVLVAEKQGAKSVVVGIVGGAYSGGGKDDDAEGRKAAHAREHDDRALATRSPSSPSATESNRRPPGIRPRKAAATSSGQSVTWRRSPTARSTRSGPSRPGRSRHPT